jgi:hypothetical protein
MANSPEKYTTHLKKLPDSLEEREVKKIVDSIESSRKAGQSDPVKYKDKHVAVLRKAADSLKSLLAEAKKKKDPKGVKAIEAMISQCQDEIQMLSSIKV